MEFYGQILGTQNKWLSGWWNYVSLHIIDFEDFGMWTMWVKTKECMLKKKKKNLKQSPSTY